MLAGVPGSSHRTHQVIGRGGRSIYILYLSKSTETGAKKNSSKRKSTDSIPLLICKSKKLQVLKCTEVKREMFFAVNETVHSLIILQRKGCNRIV